jgi:hypothetical protein
MPAYTMLEPPKIESVLDRTIPVEMHQSQTEPKTVNPALISKTLLPKEERIEQEDDASFWQILGDDRMSTPTSSSEFEIGNGLMGDGPSILDYHMEMEHIPGFATLQPMRSAPTTSSYISNICESQAGSSLETSYAGKFDDPTAGQIEGRELSHTPESQKPLLINESPMELNSESSQPPKSVPRTSIVDRNGSPRLMAQSVKSKIAPQFDLDGEKGNEETTSDTETSISESEREFWTGPKSEGYMCTRFARDMFLEYGIEMENLTGCHLWPPHPGQKHQSSLSPEDTADGTNSEKASTTRPSSSQRTIDERALGCAPPKNHGIDQSFRTDISGSTQPASKSHQYSTTDDHDDMEWISTLQVAQKDVHHLLQQTNSVSRKFLFVTGSVLTGFSICLLSWRQKRPRSVEFWRSTERGAVGSLMIYSRRKKHECSYTGSKCKLSRNSMQIYVKTWFVDYRSLTVGYNKGQSERKGDIIGYIYYFKGDTIIRIVIGRS